MDCGVGRHGVVGGIAIKREVEDIVGLRRNVRQRSGERAVHEEIHLLDRMSRIGGIELEGEIGGAAQQSVLGEVAP